MNQHICCCWERVIERSSSCVYSLAVELNAQCEYFTKICNSFQFVRLRKTNCACYCLCIPTLIRDEYQHIPRKWELMYIHKHILKNIWNRHIIASFSNCSPTKMWCCAAVAKQAAQTVQINKNYARTQLCAVLFINIHLKIISSVCVFGEKLVKSIVGGGEWFFLFFCCGFYLLKINVF